MEHIRASGHLKHAIDRIPFLQYEIWVMELIDKLNLEKLVSFNILSFFSSLENTNVYIWIFHVFSFYQFKMLPRYIFFVNL